MGDWTAAAEMRCTPFCIHSAGRCRRDAAHAIRIGATFRMDWPVLQRCGARHSYAWTSQASAAEMRRTVKTAECTVGQVFLQDSFLFWHARVSSGDKDISWMSALSAHSVWRFTASHTFKMLF